MKNLIIIGCCIFGIFFVNPVSLWARGNKNGEAPKEKKVRKAKKDKEENLPLIEITLTGKITKEEVKNKRGKVKKDFVFTDTAGNKIQLPKQKKKKRKKKQEDPKEEEPVTKTFNYQDYLDVEIKITGKGTETTDNDKVTITLKTIENIEKVEP